MGAMVLALALATPEVRTPREPDVDGEVMLALAAGWEGSCTSTPATPYSGGISIRYEEIEVKVKTGGIQKSIINQNLRF